MRVPFTRAIEVEVLRPRLPAAGASGAVLALHGMGESGIALSTLVAAHASASDRTWVFPNGPHAFERRRVGGIGHAWYLFSGDQVALRESMQESIVFLDTVLDAAQLEGDVALLGFSQGGYLASVYGALRPERVSRICVAGGRIKHEFFGHAGDPAPRFLQLHGDGDESVSPELAADAVAATRRKGYDVDLRRYEGVGHELTPGMVEDFCQWIAQ